MADTDILKKTGALHSPAPGSGCSQIISPRKISEENISLMFSYANIPWLGKSFMGLISFLRIGEKLYRFGTYTRAKIDQLTTIDGRLTIQLSDRHHVLSIQVENGAGGMLKAPKNGMMAAEIRESISGVVHVSLTKKTGEIIYQGTGTQTGVEISEGMEKTLGEALKA